MATSHGMSDPQNNKESLAERERRALPFFVEFVKFATAFAIIMMCALIALHAASAAMP
ncbi:MAG TPA: hypothetical protein VMV62_02615 [Candidatus Paceibacterota bacterium]|nr:hypothetical protein [Candidatus Paceibacterota bacterium]